MRTVSKRKWNMSHDIFRKFIGNRIRFQPWTKPVMTKGHRPIQKSSNIEIEFQNVFYLILITSVITSRRLMLLYGNGLGRRGGTNNWFMLILLLGRSGCLLLMSRSKRIASNRSLMMMRRCWCYGINCDARANVLRCCWSSGSSN